MVLKKIEKNEEEQKATYRFVSVKCDKCGKKFAVKAGTEGRMPCPNCG